MAERVCVIGGEGLELLEALDSLAVHGNTVEVVGVVNDGATDVNLDQLTGRNVAFLGTLESLLVYGDYDAKYVLALAGLGKKATCGTAGLRWDEAVCWVRSYAHSGRRILRRRGSRVCLQFRQLTRESWRQDTVFKKVER